MSNLPKPARIFCVFVLAAGFFAIHPQARAAIDSCTASVDAHSVAPNSTNSMNFTVTNGGPDSASWVKIHVPQNFTFAAGSQSAPDGWSASINGDNTEMTVSGSSFGTGTDLPVGVQATSANVTAGSANWSIQISEDGGTTTVDCGGDSRGTAIEGTVSMPPPQISNIVVSGISDSQATVSWDTDLSTNSVINYGTTTDYGQNKSDSSYVQSHSLTISGLTANTTYHYDVSGADSSGNGSDAGDNTFVTAAAGSTTTSTTGTVTTTTTQTVIVRIPTPVPDTSPPELSVSTKFTKPFSVSPTIQGSASDKSGVATIEYSLDDGKTWLPVDALSSPGAKSTTFEFTPPPLLDDNYTLRMRSTDIKGNTGTVAIGTLIIDRLPPRIGGTMASIGPQVLSPSQDGSYIIPTGIDVKLTISAVGGPTNIDLGYTNKHGVFQKVSLDKNTDNGLWSTMFNFDTPGTYTLSAHAVDGANNVADRDIGSFIVVPNGSVTSGKSVVNHGTVTAYYLDSVLQKFVLWNGETYGQTNPQPIDANGSYAFYLPSGTYYLNVTSGGYKSLKTSIFTLTDARPIVTNFLLVRARAIKFGPWIIPLPDFRQTTARVNIDTSLSSSQSIISPLVGKEVPYFSLLSEGKPVTSFDLMGKPSVITFLNTWLPTATVQLSILNELAKNTSLNVLVIIPQETVSSVAIYKARGGYTIPIVADPDGNLVDPLNLHSLPIHVIVDRKGTIQSIRSGVFNNSELFDMIIP